nr:phosphatase [uncultured Holophaga sp.]
MSHPVDPHTHTIASSHAYSTLGECISEARRRGIRLFAVTDHGPAMPDAPHPWHFLNLRVIPRTVEGVGILRGIEANILDESGNLDLPDEGLRALDLVLGALHEPVFPPATAEVHTRALTAAIGGGRVDILAHPGNPHFPIDIDRVVTAAAEHGVALEINNSSFNTSRRGSKPTCRRIAEAARDLGATLVMGSDAHFAPAVGDFSEAEALLQEIGFPEERLLNASAGRFLDFLERRGHPRIPELISQFGGGAL